MGERSRDSLRLFHDEDVMVEVVLQLLVGDVDAHLLEAVPLEVLKAEDIQQAEHNLVVRVTVLIFKNCVCRLEDPAEDTRVYGLTGGVPVGIGLFHGVILRDYLACASGYMRAPKNKNNASRTSYRSTLNRRLRNL